MKATHWIIWIHSVAANAMPNFEAWIPDQVRHDECGIPSRRAKAQAGVISPPAGALALVSLYLARRTSNGPHRVLWWISPAKAKAPVDQRSIDCPLLALIQRVLLGNPDIIALEGVASSKAVPILRLLDVSEPLVHSSQGKAGGALGQAR
jgi:hypothetical protein